MVAPSANARYNSIVGFVEADIGREIWLAEEERRTGRPVTPYGGGGNLLAAVGLLCYTECFGAYLSGFRGTGWSRVNFLWGYRKLGPEYRKLMDEGEHLDVYDKYRCGLVHGGEVKQPSLMAMTFSPKRAELCAVGRDPADQRLYFVVDKYLHDLHAFLVRLADHPSLGTPVETTRRPEDDERDAALTSGEDDGLP